MKPHPKRTADIPKWSALLVEAVNKPGMIMEWFVPVGETTLVSPLAPHEIQNTEPECASSALYVAPPTASAQPITQTQLALNFG